MRVRAAPYSRVTAETKTLSRLPAIAPHPAADPALQSALPARPATCHGCICWGVGVPDRVDSYRVFLSAVSSEFRAARAAVARELRRKGLTVKD